MCILLVEDNDLIREVTREILELGGHEVLEAADAATAIAMLQSPERSLIALISDLNLGPGPDGSVVGEHMAQYNADVPVIIMTGRPDLFSQKRLNDNGWTLIRKPYAPSKLLEHLQERLTV